MTLAELINQAGDWCDTEAQRDAVLVAVHNASFQLGLHYNVHLSGAQIQDLFRVFDAITKELIEEEKRPSPRAPTLTVIPGGAHGAN